MIKNFALFRRQVDGVGFIPSVVLHFSRDFWRCDWTKERSLPIALTRVAHYENLEKWLVLRYLSGRIWVARACATGWTSGSSSAVSEATIVGCIRVDRCFLMVKEGRSMMPHTATQALSINWSLGQISRNPVGRYITPLFRRWGFPNVLHSIAEINIKESCLVGNIAKDYPAIGVVGDCIRLYVQFLVD